MDFSTIQIKWKQEYERAILDENNVDFSTREITSKKLRGKNVYILTSEIMSIKVRGNVSFLTNEITSKKVRGFFDHRNYTEESTWKRRRGFFDIKITSKKVRPNDVDFSTIEITSTKVR